MLILTSVRPSMSATLLLMILAGCSVRPVTIRVVDGGSGKAIRDFTLQHNEHSWIYPIWPFLHEYSYVHEVHNGEATIPQIGINDEFSVAANGYDTVFLQFDNDTVYRWPPQGSSHTLGESFIFLRAYNRDEADRLRMPSSRVVLIPLQRLPT